jgi:hypothetical protein
MGSEPDQPGTSGVFKAIAANVQRLKRAVTGGDDELPLDVRKLGERIARAFVASRFADVYALGTAGFRERLGADTFQQRWRDTVAARGPLTGFDISSSGSIDIGFIPGLEEVPQDDFVAFLQLAFATPTVPLDAENAFVVGAVLLREDGVPRLGALHAR